MIKTILKQLSKRRLQNAINPKNMYLFNSHSYYLNYFQYQQLGCQNRCYFYQLKTDNLRTSVQFDNYVTNPKILQRIKANGLNEMFPIQSACFPLILKGEDILASDRTGSGKTLAYSLPIL